MRKGDRHPWLARVAVGIASAQVEALPQTLDEVVLGQAHPLVCPHTVVAQVLLAVKAVGGGRVLLITGAALRLSQVVRVQQAYRAMVEARGASSQAASVLVMVSVLVLNLLLGAHHHIQQVAEQKVGGRQRVHPCLRDGHLLVAGRAPQLQGVPWTPLALEALPAEGMEAGQDVEPPGGLAGGGRGM